MITDLLKDLIKIDTRAAIANETEAAAYLKKVCDGFKIDSRIIEPVKGKGSFIAHIPGRDKSKKEILLLSHLDTAEFGDLEKWKFHPLSAEEYKGRIIGRGAIDCKGLVSLWLSVLISIQKGGFSPERGIVLAAVADEENGGRYGMEYLIDNNELINNCHYVIGEGGGIPLKLGDTRYYTCQNAEQEGYQAKPNPIMNLLTGLTTTKIYNAELLGFLVKQFLYRPKQRKLDINPLLNASANYTSLETELYKIIVSETAKISTNNKVIPYTTPGYSDNRYLRSKGKVVYGYFPLSLDDNLAGVHGCNENISIQGLINSYHLMSKIILRFTHGKATGY